MKICCLADASSIHIKKWVSYFVKKGYDMHVISFEDGIIEGANVHRIQMLFLFRNKTFLLKLMYMGKIKKIIKEIKPDILHAFYVTNYGYFASKMDFHPLIVSAQGSDILKVGTESKLLTYIKKKIAQKVVKKIDLILIEGNKIKNKLFYDYRVDPKKMVMQQSGVDVEKFKPDIDSLVIKNKLDINGRLSVISLRNFYPEYDVKTLIRAIPAVIDVYPTCKFIVAGKGSQEEKLRELATKLKIMQPYNLEFIGHIENDDLPKYLNAVDIYVSTASTDSGISMSTAEAMACGLPVIVTDVEDNSDWIENKVNGFLIPFEYVVSLSERIVRLLDDKNLRKEFGKLGRKTIVERDNYDEEMKNMENIYEKIYGSFVDV